MDLYDIKMNVFSCLKCTIDGSKYDHISEEPIQLSCDHFICKKCLKPSIDHRKIKCKTCKTFSEVNLVNEKETSQTFDCILNNNLTQLLHFLRAGFEENLKIFSDMISGRDEVIELHIEFIKDKIQIKIESLKAELDALYESFSGKLDEISVEHKNNLNHSYMPFGVNQQRFSTDLEELEKVLTDNQSMNQETFYNYQDKLNDLQKQIDELRKISPKISFNEGENRIPESFVGEIMYSDVEYIKKQITNRIKDGYFKTCMLDGIDEPYEVCALPNNNLLVTNGGLLVYDKNMVVIKTMERIGHFNNILCAVCDFEKNEIYFSDWSKNAVFKTDLDFNKIAEFVNGAAAGDNELIDPAGMCFYNGSLFVCDTRNERIQKFDSNFVYEASYKLNFRPLYIKNINNVAFIKSSSASVVAFYNLDSFDEIKRYARHNGFIGVVGNVFYEYNREEGTDEFFFCYNEKGELEKQIPSEHLGLKSFDDWGAICLFNMRLVICSRFTRRLVYI